MNKDKKLTKEDIKITCFYDKNGMEVSKILEKSFEMFVKSEVMKK